MRYRWIRQNRDVFPVAAMCRVLKVSDSGYYGWVKRKPSPRAIRIEKIREDVRATFEQSVACMARARSSRPWRSTINSNRLAVTR